MTDNSALIQTKLAELSQHKAKLLERLLEKRSGALQRITPRPREIGARAQRFPASSQQKRLWFIDRLDCGSAAYHISLAVRLEGGIELPALRAALDALVIRHEALRTVFVLEDGEPVQEVRAATPFPLHIVEIETRGEVDLEAEIRRRAHEQARLPFILHTGPLVRGTLLRVSPDVSEHILLIVMHHIISDGWSLGVLMRELGALYVANLESHENQLTDLRLQYGDYAHWQQQWMAGPQLQDHLKYWEEHLRGAPELLELPIDRRRPSAQSYRGAEASISFDASLCVELKSFAQRARVTPAMILHCAWVVLLSRLTGQQDIVVGVPVANRRRAEVEGVIGLFVNTLAVRVRLDDDPSLADLLQRVRDILLAAYTYQDAPFEQVVETLRPSRSLSYTPIFQVAISVQSEPATRVAAPGLLLSEHVIPIETAQFDLSLALRESPQGLVGMLNYATDLFDATTIERWCSYFTTVLATMLHEPKLHVSRVQLVGDMERCQLLEAFNAKESVFPRDALIHELIEEQVERTPHEVAVISGGEHLTYRRLNSRANQLARYLRQQGAGPERFVGLCVERGVEMVVGLLAILKSGAAYVPLDPSYPQHRLEYMLQDTAPIAVLTQEHLKDRLPVGQNVLVLDTQWSEIAQQAGSNLGRASPQSSSSNLAYVIYTSGSTGRPKGVAIEHRHAVNMICWAQSVMKEEIFEQTLQSTSLNFDLSVYECFVPLVSGGSLRVVRNALALASELPANVTLINTVPSAISALLDAGGIPASTRVVNLAGEALKKELVERIFAHTTVQCVNNLYGPSETTTYSTWIAMPREQGFNATIGHPIANTQVYILDVHRQLAPVGVVGEIYIGGAGVARGYLNREELTVERFLTDPFRNEPQARMYKTGDLGRWRADGTIEYLGRNDHQVKIRGFRIELGEIEAGLLSHERVKEAVVLAREDSPGEKRLIAYVVASDPALPPTIDGLRAHLKAILPEYMAPSAFVQLEQMPLTPNGKLDRSALPRPELDAYSSREYEPPQGELEATLAEVWQQLLRVHRVGRRDNFFELGGHSLLIMSMMERLRRLGLSTDVRRVFESPTLADLAVALRREAGEQLETSPNLIPPDCKMITPEMLPLLHLEPQHIDGIVQAVPGGLANIQDIYPLVPLQEGLLFHHLMSERSGDIYVVPHVLCVSSRRRLDLFLDALQAVIDRHDILRTAILWEQLPRPVQVVYRHATLSVEEVAPAHDVAQLVEEWIRPERQQIDLRTAPLMRVQIARAHESDEDKWYLLWQVHHIIDDATSHRIMIAELIAHMESVKAHLPPAPYRNHVAQVLAYARAHDSEEFFRGKLSDIDEPTAPFGLLDVHGDGARIGEFEQSLDLELASRLRTQAGRLGISAATLFHAAAALVVAQTSGRDDVVFGCVLLGRLLGNDDTQRMLGMFINTLPLRINLRGATAQGLVERTQHELVELLSHEQASLSVAQRCSGIVGTAPLFTVLVNYRHGLKTNDANWADRRDVEVLATRTGTNYPITLSIDDLGEGFQLTAQTDHRLNPQRVTAYLRTAVESLIRALEEAPQTPTSALTILPSSERRRLIEVLNPPASAYPEKLIHQLFEEQVTRTPDELAVIYAEASLTYRELNQRANRLARYLRAQGVQTDQLVGICMERSIDLVTALLAVLKAGGAYVPLDPNYPAERLQYMLEDAAPRVVLTQHRLARMLPVTRAQPVELDTIGQRLRQNATTNLGSDELGATPPSLVYVIYTSGSTGRPKGTVMPHRAMVNLVQWHRTTFTSTDARRVLQFAALSFDVAFQETFSTLCNGDTLVMLDEFVRRDTSQLIELLRQQAVNRLFLPPLMLQSLADHAQKAKCSLPALRDVITAGEQLRISPDIRWFFERNAACRLHNHYGPTETHVVTALTLTDAPEQWPTLPSIGRPIANTRIYILDGQRQPAPIGAAGEIYIAGANVAVGYLRRSELTEGRFVADPFGADPQARMYKTGDLGRWCEQDGTIEYLGRNDDQVKVRGFRVELGEIEIQLAGHERVREAAVIVHEDTAAVKRLVAYVTATESGAASAKELRDHLRAVLPEHMIPSVFVSLESMPLTPSGKLNRRALPAPEHDDVSVGSYEAPSGETEQALAAIWEKLLRVHRVSRDHNFFELGGHSLLVLEAVSETNSKLKCRLRVTDFYRRPTLRDLAQLIGGGAADDPLVDLQQEARLDPTIAPRAGVRCIPPRAVLLTGATGFVGRFLLAQLLHDTRATIYCLVRARSQRHAAERLKANQQQWQLWSDEWEPRIIAVPGDLRAARLGLEEGTYNLLAREVDSIYHCATSMNHLETYAMAKAANVDSARELLTLATDQKPKLINFISTLGVFGLADTASDVVRTVDERTSIDGERHRSSAGYVASKWVGEKIFLTASDRGVPCNIFRLGLIWADTRMGRYDELQHDYRLIKSCLISKCGIANHRYHMAPTPVDYAARAIVHLANRHSNGRGVFHISAARTQIDRLFERCNAILETQLELLPLYDWILEMKRLHENGQLLPVIPLIQWAFSMSREAFEEQQRRLLSRRASLDCCRTQRELQEAGIETPVVNDHLLQLCVEEMLFRDKEGADLAQELGASTHLPACDGNRWSPGASTAERTRARSP